MWQLRKWQVSPPETSGMVAPLLEDTVGRLEQRLRLLSGWFDRAMHHRAAIATAMGCSDSAGESMTQSRLHVTVPSSSEQQLRLAAVAASPVVALDDQCAQAIEVTLTKLRTLLLMFRKRRCAVISMDCEDFFLFGARCSTGLDGASSGSQTAVSRFARAASTWAGASFGRRCRIYAQFCVEAML